jgi:hypothetical protein
MAMTETAEAKEIPYFIKVAGCNNCKVFKSYTSLSGTGLRKQAVAKTKKVIARFGEFYDHRGRLKPWVVKTLSKKKNNAQ